MSRPGGWRRLVGRDPSEDIASSPQPGTPDTTALVVYVGEQPIPTHGAGPAWTSTPWHLLGTEHTRRWSEIIVTAPSLADLRRIVPWLERAGRAPRITLLAEATDRPEAVVAPTVVGRRAVVDLGLTRGPDGTVRLTVELARPTRVSSVARAALFPRRNGRRAPAAGLRLGLTGPAAAPWAAADPGAALLGTESEDTEVPRLDAVLSEAGDPDPGLGVALLHVARHDLFIPPVDAAMCSPRGFVATDSLNFADSAVPVLRSDRAGGWEVVLDGAVLLARLDSAPTEQRLQSLRPLRLLRLDPGVGASGEATAAMPLASLLAHLCCAGVPVSAPRLPAPVADGLGPGLAGRLLGLDPLGLADPVERESWSVSTRRLALARFAAPAYWSARGAERGLAVTPDPSVSVLLATRRPELVPFALAQIARQSWSDLEIVIVLHGAEGAEASVRAAAAEIGRTVTVVTVGSDVVFGRALNAGLAACSGRLVTKMDDDDWYGPHHVEDLVQAHEHSGATLIGTGGYHVYLGSADTTVRFTTATEAPTHRVHGGTMLLAAEDLRALGGWRPVPVGEDAELIRAVHANGGWLYGIHDLGFLYFRGADHTWQPAEGDARWLTGTSARTPGLCPPPQLEPLPHPLLARG